MELLIDELENLIKEKKDKSGVTHDSGKIDKILPYNSSKITKVVKDRFDKLLGEFTRLISNVKYSIDKKNENHEYEDEKSAIANILKDIEYKEDSRNDLRLFLENYLFGNGNDFRKIHPYIFNYLSLKPPKNEEIKFAKFMKDVLVIKPSEFNHIFEKNKGENLLVTLVLKNLAPLEKREDHDKSYNTLMPVVSNLFKEDFDFISKHRDYFLEHFPMLLHYYYFMYVSQITLKFNKFDNADFEKIEPLYYALDWESLNKRRKAASDSYGYKWLKERSKELFVHIHTLSQLSHNTANKRNAFMTYEKFRMEMSDHKDEEDFLHSINRWIKIYKEKASLKQEIYEASNLSMAYEQLYKCLKEGMSSQVCEKYGRSIEDAAINKFLKSRGNLGYILNITQNFLLLLTAVSVKNQRIPLKKLFDEFEKRGIALDRYSIKEVITLLDNLNIIDKKSDSGDAQYVKPIL